MLLTSLLLVGLISDAQAAGTASLGGTVRAKNTKAPLPGVEVTANGPGGFGQATTEAAGKYMIPGLGAGAYTVTFTAPKFVLRTTSTALSEGEAGVLDSELEATGSLSGTVTSAASGAGLGGVVVFITRLGGGEELERSGITESNGHYTINEVPPGSYNVNFTPPSNEYIPQNTSVTVFEAAAATSNAALRQAGKISGRVTDTYTHNGLGKIGIFANGQGGIGSGFATTNDNGEYTVTGLSTGSYKLEYSWEFSEAEEKEFENAPRFIPKYITQFFNGQISMSAANTVSATEGNTTSGIDVAMVPSAPHNTALPTVTGTTTVGSQLLCSSGSWTGESTLPLSSGWPLTSTFAYQWLRQGSAIAGMTSPTYIVQAADVGHGLECEVTATNDAGHAGAKSAAVAIANPVPVLKSSAKKLRVAKGSVTVSITCANAPCVGKAQLVQTVIVKSRKGHRKVSKKTTLVLATGSYSLAAGKTGTVKLRLTKAGTRKLAGGRLSAKLVVSTTGGKALEQAVQLLAGSGKKK
ncbi:MAG TPA: carboxypeptidase regulatory-like domain-containing protein [Solirubrobacteraceae bacterium]|nr:carboxypeptidase regulatory-like domain-containing protein [Solirubrobacteraceae bacterium]